MQTIEQMAKAILASLIAVLGSLATVLVGNVGLADVTAGQWVTIALAGLTALAAVYGVPNAKPPE